MGLVETDHARGVTVITLNDPERRNAFTPASVTELVAAVDAAEADPDCRALIITGAPPAFCGGADLSHLEAGDRSSMLAIYEGFLRVARCRLPTIAAVNGAAVGAGMNLALACDVRLVSESGWFDTRFLKLGLHPGGGHTWMLRTIVGPQRAAALVLFGEHPGGEHAVAAGLALRCVADEDLLDTARILASGATHGSRALAERIKETLIGMAEVTDLDEAVARELDAQVWSLGQPAFSQGLRDVRAGIAGRR